jgi:transcriptional regulator with XRE-family HTH domain
MSTPTDTSKKIHQGRNVKRFREMMGLKQESLADRLGAEWSQKKISQIESSEVIEQDLLEQLADALKVPAEAIKNFDEEKAIYYIQNNYEGSNPNASNGPNMIGPHYHECTFNPLDKFVAAVERNEQLFNETKRLYEELLKSEREKVLLLERLLERK